MNRLMNDQAKFDKIVELVNEYVEMSEDEISDFMDGGDEGWDCGDDNQSLWLNDEPAQKIADWIIAGQ